MPIALPLLLLVSLLSSSNLARAGNPTDLIRVLQHKSCRSCDLADADLVHADLRDADLTGSQLQRANLSQAKLDGAKLRDSDLSFTSLRGASLRGADLRGSKIYGTDLRNADLSGALLDDQALEQSHWQAAQGIQVGVRSHAVLHNAGVDAASAGRWQDAEQLFNAAIQSKPNEPLSWVARGISRGEQDKFALASNDLAHAGRLYEQQGDSVKAKQLQLASTQVMKKPGNPEPKGNGFGSKLLGGTLSTMQTLAPLAIRALAPMIP